MDRVRQIAAKLVTLIRDHLQIEGEPPPPCKDVIGIARIAFCGHELRQALPVKTTIWHGTEEELWRRTAVEQIRRSLEEFCKGFPYASPEYRAYVDPDYVAMKTTEIPPVDPKVVRSLEWAVNRLGELDGPEADVYLGIRFDEDNLTAYRDGHEDKVEFARKSLPWKLFRLLVKAGENGVSLDILRKEFDLGGKDEAGLRGHKSTVNEVVAPLRVEIDADGRGIWRVKALPDPA